MVFSSIPKDHSTWLYLQLSPSGVAFYQQMVLKKRDIGRSIGTLGDKSLFETFFICVNQPKGENIRYLYMPFSLSGDQSYIFFSQHFMVLKYIIVHVQNW